MKCCICDKEIHGHPNSPARIDGDYCCDECNVNLDVILFNRDYMKIKEKVLKNC